MILGNNVSITEKGGIKVFVKIMWKHIPNIFKCLAFSIRHRIDLGPSKIQWAMHTIYTSYSVALSFR